MSNIKVKDLYTPSGIDYIDEYVFSKEYPWELLGGIKEYIKSLIEKGMPGFDKIQPDVLIGQNTTIAKTATIIGSFSNVLTASSLPMRMERLPA